MIAIKITAQGCIHFKDDIINYDDCWTCRGAAYWDEDYPIINRHGKNWIASRFVWYFFTHRDYRNKEVHHKCHNRACINPFHLEELSKKKHRRYHHELRSNQKTNKTSK